MAQWLHVGKIMRPHGLKGEVCVKGSTDFPEKRFEVGNTLYLSHQDQPDLKPLVISSHRKNKKIELLGFYGVNHIDDVETWRDAALKVPKDELTEDLDDGEYYYHEIIGCRVLTEEGDEIGHVKEILQTGANDVWVVKGKLPKEILIPYIDDVVKSIDLVHGTIHIHVMEGLLE